MDDASLNPVIVIFLFILRCLIPIGLLLGISYLFRRLGLIAQPAKPPQDWENNHNHPSEGGLTHE